MPKNTLIGFDNCLAMIYKMQLKEFEPFNYIQLTIILFAEYMQFFLRLKQDNYGESN